MTDCKLLLFHKLLVFHNHEILIHCCFSINNCWSLEEVTLKQHSDLKAASVVYYRRSCVKTYKNKGPGLYGLDSYLFITGGNGYSNPEICSENMIVITQQQNSSLQAIGINNLNIFSFIFCSVNVRPERLWDFLRFSFVALTLICIKYGLQECGSRDRESVTNGSAKSLILTGWWTYTSLDKEMKHWMPSPGLYKSSYHSSCHSSNTKDAWCLFPNLCFISCQSSYRHR